MEDTCSIKMTTINKDGSPRKKWEFVNKPKTWTADCLECGKEFESFKQGGQNKKYCCKAHKRKYLRRVSYKRHGKKWAKAYALKHKKRDEERKFIRRFIKELQIRCTPKKIKIRCPNYHHRKHKKVKIRIMEKPKVRFCKVCDQGFMKELCDFNEFCSTGCKRGWKSATSQGECKRRGRNVVSWLTHEQKKSMALTYASRPRNHEVDHDIPSKGKNVSGLHIPENLKYLHFKDNSSKGNSFE